MLARCTTPRLPLKTEDDEWDFSRLSIAVGQLQGLALVRKSNVRGSWMLSMHPLTYGWLTARQEEAQFRQRMQTSGCIVALSEFGDPGWRPYRESLAVHLLKLLAPNSGLVGDGTLPRRILQVLIWLGWRLHKLRYDREVGRLVSSLFQFLSADSETPSVTLGLI
jgi:hypothetical protein